MTSQEITVAERQKTSMRTNVRSVPSKGNVENTVNSLTEASSSYKAQDLSRHYVGTLTCKSIAKLVGGKGCEIVVRDIVKRNQAQITGVLLHEFPNGSYTLLVGLSESHISIHTWPEMLTVQLDVFLCNYVHDNSEKCRKIYEEIVDYFDVAVCNTTVIKRV